MKNSSEFGVTIFILTPFSAMERLSSMYFSIFLFVYIAIIVENLTLIGLILLQKSLHEPMCLFVCNLAANSLYGSTALMPAMMRHIISRSYEVALSSCLLQVFAIHTYVIVEFAILAAMSYDRYIAICRPLHYHILMPLSKVYKIITLTWILPIIAFLAVFVFTLRLRFCDRVIQRLYCLNFSLVKLSCTNTATINIVGIISVCLYSMPQIAIIFYTYGHILKICLLSSKESRMKAIKTCTPHLLALINYASGCFFEIAQSRFQLRFLTFEFRSFLSLYFLICTPILNPAIYGVSIQRIRTPLLRIFKCNRRIMATP